MKCLVCATPTQTESAFWHRVCPACHYESADLSPTINQAEAHDQVNESDRETALKNLRAENFKVIVEHIDRLVPPSANKLLDVGSAHGWFLEQANGRFQVLGIEPDVAVGERPAARGLPVRIGYFPDALAPGERFDVIVFNDVIEHIPDIAGALRACSERLTADGLLVLNLPNSRGFFYRLSKLFARVGLRGPFERMWQKGLPSPHVHYFNKDNLKALATRHGFVAAHTFHLASLQAAGLLERLRFVGKINPIVLYTQYVALLCAIPFLRLVPSDIVVCTYRKKAGI